jgi:hypothetical protein
MAAEMKTVPYYRLLLLHYYEKVYADMRFSILSLFCILFILYRNIMDSDLSVV